jgi:hypothetical protein
VEINTALVSPKTASALVRALQTVDDPWYFNIPAADEDTEIKRSPYKLVGWLSYDYSESRIDDNDPFRNEILPVRCRPSNNVISALNLRGSTEIPGKWLNNTQNEVIFDHESWSDLRWDDREDPYFRGKEVYLDGWRLSVDKKTLETFLNKRNLDLIIEVKIRRKDKGYDYSQYDKKEPKEVEFERIFLLRKDGTFEAAEGRIGTWKTPGP